MTIKKKFTGTIKNGKVIFDEPELITLRTHSLEGKRVFITMEVDKAERSTSQNKYYWGVVIKLLEEETGQDRQSLHEVIKEKFLTSWVKINGHEEKMVKSTSELDTKEFETLMSSVRQWASSFLGVYIPEPNEVQY